MKSNTLSRACELNISCNAPADVSRTIALNHNTGNERESKLNGQFYVFHERGKII